MDIPPTRLTHTNPGWPARDAAFDALPGFQKPPPGFGEVAFYWWQGDPLTKDRLLWQLDLLQGRGITGLQINYSHSDTGGLSFGLTDPGDPPLFSEAWWDLFGWFLAEANARGMSVSLSDYTLGIGQGWHGDALLSERPDMAGAVLEAETRAASGGTEIDWPLTETLLNVTASAGDETVDLAGHVRNNSLHWTAPADNDRILALGEACASAEVHVNGDAAGVLVCPPWTMDISRWVRVGVNRLDVLVYNTLSNHYQTIPTRYKGSSPSGLLGPIVLYLFP